MLPSNVSLCYQFNGPKLNEYQFNAVTSLIQWIGKTERLTRFIPGLFNHLLSWKITKCHFFTTIIGFRGF